MKARIIRGILWTVVVLAGVDAAAAVAAVICPPDSLADLGDAQ